MVKHSMHCIPAHITLALGPHNPLRFNFQSVGSGYSFPMYFPAHIPCIKNELYYRHWNSQGDKLPSVLCMAQGISYEPVHIVLTECHRVGAPDGCGKNGSVCVCVFAHLVCCVCACTSTKAMFSFLHSPILAKWLVRVAKGQKKLSFLIIYTSYYCWIRTNTYRSIKD